MGSVHWGEKFFKFIINIDQSEMNKRQMFNTGTDYAIKIDQSQMSHSKIASKGKNPLIAK